ncbi:Uncharacterised protein [Mycobacteroides abscessus subsp. abscessus]|nr:Uncharacterised protein [Mycobacteroides abscessus subsp. abscessus]
MNEVASLFKSSTVFERRMFVFALIVIAIYLLPLFVLGENAHIRVHDNLDSNLAWYKVLSRSGELFGEIDAVIPQVINGLPRNAFGTEFSGIVWLHHFLPTMTAYAISQAITRIFAFLGMYLLLRDYYVPKSSDTVIRIGVALAFALTPFWPSGMLSTLGMPLALWGFLNVRSGKKTWKNVIIFTFLPFYSSFVLGFFFFMVAMGIFWFYELLTRKKLQIRFFLSIMYMTVVFLLVEYRLVSSFLVAGEPNSRDEYIHATLPLWRVIRLTFKNFILGHTHVMTVHGLVILPILFIALFLVLINKSWKEHKMYLTLFVLNFFLSLWYAFWFYEGWAPIVERFHFLNTFNFARFHFLRPLIIYINFAQALFIIKSYIQKNGYIRYILVAQIMLLFAFNEEIINHRKPTVKQFYATEQFENIKAYIERPVNEYRVVSIGLHPAIAQYNGFYTLDTYNNFYPLTYKHQFRTIIEKELSKNKKIKRYFDEWGGRCYIFTAQMGKHYMVKKNSSKTLKNLQLQTSKIKELGGEYVFSALPIKNADENKLQLEKIFQSDSSAWTIYLYKLY